MNRQEFDAHAKSYNEVLDKSIVCSGEDSTYFAEYKIRDLYLELLGFGADVGSGLRLLDFGCGVGASTPFVRRYFPNAEMLSVDVSEESLDLARTRHGELAKFLVMTGDNLPEEVHTLDAVYAMCVFHHVDEGKHVELLSQMRSSLKPDGLLMVYEHNPFNPLTVRIVNNCPFDANAKLIHASVMAERCRLAGFKDVKVKYRVFIPGFLRIFRFIERLLSWLPLGGQYYVRCIA